MGLLDDTRDLVGEVAQGWGRNGTTELAAALAYFAALATAPLLVFLAIVAAIVFGAATARAVLADPLAAMLGEQSAAILRDAVVAALKSPIGQLPVIVTVLAAASGVVGLVNQVRGSLHRIFGVVPARKGLVHGALRMVVAFGLVLAGGAAALLVIALETLLVPSLPGPTSVLSRLLLATALWVAFGTIYRIAARGRLTPAGAWVGAAAGTVATLIAATVLAVYFSFGIFPDVYGVLGAVMVVLVWLFAIAVSFLGGAEVARSYDVVRDRRGAGADDPAAT